MELQPSDELDEAAFCSEFQQVCIPGFLLTKNFSSVKLSTSFMASRLQTR
jgi:hypothetical protein